MEAFDYNGEATLYCCKTSRGRQNALTFRRFDRAAEAVRYAIEELSPKALAGCSLEVDDERYGGRSIRPLYDSAEFPLVRRLEKTC